MALTNPFKGAFSGIISDAKKASEGRNFVLEMLIAGKKIDDMSNEDILILMKPGVYDYLPGFFARELTYEVTRRLRS